MPTISTISHRIISDGQAASLESSIMVLLGLTAVRDRYAYVFRTQPSDSTSILSLYLDQFQGEVITFSGLFGSLASGLSGLMLGRILVPAAPLLCFIEAHRMKADIRHETEWAEN